MADDVDKAQNVDPEESYPVHMVKDHRYENSRLMISTRCGKVIPPNTADAFTAWESNVTCTDCMLPGYTYTGATVTKTTP